MYYLVFTGRKWRNAMGKQGITWEPGGVYEMDTAEQACLAAAQEHGVGTCFAVDGYAWGVDTIDAGQVRKLGEQVDPLTRLERMGEKLATQFAALAAPQAKELPEGDNHDGE